MFDMYYGASVTATFNYDSYGGGGNPVNAACSMPLTKDMCDEGAL